VHHWVAVLVISSFALASESSANAQSIRYDEARHTWLLTTKQNSYAIGVDSNGALRNLYWGAPLWRMEDLPPVLPRRELSSFDPPQMMENEEFPGWGGTRYFEPAIPQ
jgi:hypothetical protein